MRWTPKSPDACGRCSKSRSTWLAERSGVREATRPEYSWERDFQHGVKEEWPSRARGQVDAVSRWAQSVTGTLAGTARLGRLEGERVAVQNRWRRGVAQPGSAPALGAGCRRFKSSHPDHYPALGPARPLRHMPWRARACAHDAARSGRGELGKLQEGASGEHDPLAGVALTALPFHPDVVISAEQSDHRPDGIERRITKLNEVTDLKTELSRGHGPHDTRVQADAELDLGPGPSRVPRVGVPARGIGTAVYSGRLWGAGCRRFANPLAPTTRKESVNGPGGGTRPPGAAFTSLAGAVGPRMHHQGGIA
jgi:hypothetical protein